MSELARALEKAITDAIADSGEVDPTEINTAMYQAAANVNRKLESSAG